MRTGLALLIAAAACLAGGCGIVLPADPSTDGPAYVVLPAQPRDDLFGPASSWPVSVASLESSVVAWHSAARWDELERVIRRSAARRESVVVSLWRGEVLRPVNRQRRHECWYLVVLIGSPLRPAENGTPVASVCSLEFAVPAAFLSAVEDALELYEQETGPNRAVPVRSRGGFPPPLVGQYRRQGKAFGPV